MTPSKPPIIRGQLKKHIITTPEIIDTASGIRINGRLIRSLIFTTDIAIMRNMNADAVMCVYPFTPQPVITQALMTVAEVPLFCGVGGGTTQGPRVVNLAKHAEYQGAMGVVVNAPTQNEIIRDMAAVIDIPIVLTVVNDRTDIEARLKAGASILNVSCASRTPEVVRAIRRDFPDVPIIATGGPTDASIAQTIEAGANAVTYTPPSAAEIFKELMNIYRSE